MIKGIIFDVDGVIINTENTHFLAYVKVFKEYGYQLTLDDYLKHFSGKSIRGGVLSLLTEHTINTSSDQEGLINEITQKKVSQTLERFKKKVDYFEDTLKFIQHIEKGNLHLKGVGQVVENPILAMATGLESAFFEYVLAQHNLKQLFPIIVTADHYSHSKPNPECYLMALNKMVLTPNEVVGIEDSVSGVKALNSAGIFSIAVTTTNQASDLLEAKVVTKTLTELITLQAPPLP